MKLPYNHLHAHGNVLFAARGGKIHQFSLVDGSHITTWKHPDVDRVASAVKAIAEAEEETKEPEVEDVEPETEEGQPPAKRQRLESGSAATTEGDATKAKDDEGKRKGKKQKGRNRNHDYPNRVSRVPDRPVITQMTSTANGRYLVAVTGHDKNIWVFAHEGQEQLKQLSSRTMPKRPSSVVIGPDSNIICADKFGDVYALPLIPEAIPEGERLSKSSTPAKLMTKPAASTLTVHSKKNLMALKHQQQQIEERLAKGLDLDSADGPDFEFKLLLGHVSMLTSIAVAESEGRRYILTSDRDEHIRLSRYIPQAHIIEGFCFGHKEFISTMVIPPAKGDLLVSGGGDPELFIWDWKAGSLLSKTSILPLAQAVDPEVTKVAVSGLYTLQYPAESGDLTYVLAICEDIKAILSWELKEDNTLKNPGAIQLPGKPLHLAISPADEQHDSPLRLIVAIDPGETTPTKSLHVFTLTMSDRRLAVDTETSVQDEALETDEPEVTEEDVRGLLSTTEKLRKQPSAESAEDGGAGDEAAA